MKFTLSWLKQHLETDADLATIDTTLTALGLEVEEIVNRGPELALFTVAHVIEARPHPNADKLQICKVDTGSETIEVVCGAPNARTGMKAVFAGNDLVIPGSGMKLKPTEIRGVQSNGMLVSEREMGLSDEHEGIIEMPDDAPIGTPFAEILNLDDPMIEIAILPNRQDCLGVRGIARDLAAAGLGTLKPVDDSPVIGSVETPVSVSLDFDSDSADACPAFALRLIKGVINGPSPEWLQRKLLAVGLRPISALVDVTNFISLDRARPLHVFDADKVAGNLVLRLAKDGEKLLALDEEEYTLHDQVCVIADDKGVQSLGGVMGGLSTGVTEDTVNVLVESALFDTVRTAMTGRSLGIESDARYRFERGVDSNYMIGGIEDATKLILDMCGGEAGSVNIAGTLPVWDKQVDLRPERVKELCNLDIATEEMIRILGSIGFDGTLKGGVITTTVPSWRTDIDGEADLVEEVARIYGYDHIPAVPLDPISANTVPAIDGRQRRVRRAKRTLADCGFNEAVTWSFTSKPFADLFGGGQPELTLSNPISSELNTMRPTLLPNLLDAAQRNQARGFKTIALFEVGAQFAGDTPEDQSMVATGIRVGPDHDRHWTGASLVPNALGAKADALAVLKELGAPVDNLKAERGAADWYHPGRSGVLKLGPKNVVAAFGEVHPRVLSSMDVDGPVAAFEIYLDVLPYKAPKKTSRSALNASDLQAVERDFAFVVDVETPAADVIAAAKNVDKKLIDRISLFDVYEGKGMDEGKKSLAICVRLQPVDDTLTDKEIDALSDQVVAAVAKATGGVLRG
jgi:phenylalanyl-tRNA synthetase beta chain